MASFILLGGSIIVTGYYAMMYENTGLMLLAYLQAALFVLSFFAVIYRMCTIRGRLEIPVGIAEPEKENLVKLIITNKGFLPLMRSEALISVEDVCTGRKTKEWKRLSSVSKGEITFVRTVSFAGTGTYRLRLKKLKVYDFTGLFYGKIKGKGEQKVQVMPRLHDIPVRLSLAVRNFFGESDVYDEYMPGHDNSELFDVREYQKGDRLQNIHWKLTAKQDDLMVKEQSLPKACPVVLFLDFHPLKKRNRQERMIPYLETAASLVFSLVDAKCPHYVVWFDEKAQDIVRLRVDDEEGLFFFLGILMEIAWVQPKEDLKLRYGEKYKREPYVWALSLDEKLVLKKADEVIAQLSERELTQSLAQVELVL